MYPLIAAKVFDLCQQFYLESMDNNKRYPPNEKFNINTIKENT